MFLNCGVRLPFPPIPTPTVTNSHKTMVQLSKTFKDKPPLMKIVEEIRKQVDEFKPVVPVVTGAWRCVPPHKTTSAVQFHRWYGILGGCGLVGSERVYKWRGGAGKGKNV